jgi:hypothetical protein
VPAVCFVGVALYAWRGAAPEQEELVEAPGLALG